MARLVSLNYASLKTRENSDLYTPLLLTQMIKESIELGATGFITKPSTMALLIKTLSELITAKIPSC